MHRTLAGLALAALLVAGCSRRLVPESTDPDTDTSDPDSSDPDTSDTDSDDDTEDDTDLLDCDATYATPTPGGVPDYPGCYTEILECGDLIHATVVGGTDEIDDYTQWLCAGDVDLSGPERVYAFVQRPGQSAIIRLHDDCGTLRLINFNNGNSIEDELASDDLCGGYSSNKTCDVGTGLQGYQEQAYPVIPESGQDRHLEIIVDSAPNRTGNYVLEVICDNG